MTLSPSVLFARSMRYGPDKTPQTPTNTQRYNTFRARTNEPPINNHPWPHLRHIAG